MSATRTLFSASPFQLGGYSRSMTPVATRHQPMALRGPSFRPVAHRPAKMGDIFDDLMRQVEGLLPEVDDLIKQLPVEHAGNFEQRRDDCLAQPISTRYTCLIKLTREIRDAIKGEKDEPTKTPTTTTNGKPPEKEFPWIWVAAGGVTLAAVIFALTRKKG